MQIVVGDFSPDDFDGFQTLAVEGVNKLLAAGVKNLIVDVHNNGGGFICLGAFLYTLLSGTKSGYECVLCPRALVHPNSRRCSGYQTTMRANPLAQKIVAKVIEEDIEFLNYTPDNWAFLNDTIFPNNHNFITPPDTIIVNGQKDQNSQRFHVRCFSLPNLLTAADAGKPPSRTFRNLLTVILQRVLWFHATEH